MENTFLVQVFGGLHETEYTRVRKFLQSPYFNRRPDVLALFDWLVRRANHELTNDSLAAAHAAVYPGRPFSAADMHLVSRYLLALLEQYMACEQWQNDDVQPRLHLLAALRQRKLGPHFERHAQRLEQWQRQRTERHADFYRVEYARQREMFEYRILSQRNWQLNLSGIVDALGHFFALENLRWSGMIASLNMRSGAQIPDPPLSDAVRNWATTADSPVSVAVQLNSTQIMREPENETAFEALCALLPGSFTLFPPSQCRDLYMTAINFCIKRQNKGERQYTQKALELYRQALEKGILLDNGILPKYTYHNINALAHLAGEGAWAEVFLTEYKGLLPPDTRENVFQYNLAVCYFRQGQYARALELLRTVETNEIFEQLDIRRMLLRAYFALGEWAALDSLLDSFNALLQRRKDLGYHAETYRNLVRFTQKILKIRWNKPAKKAALAEKIRQTQYVAEKEWLLEQLR
jgi:hypothetical protein